MQCLGWEFLGCVDNRASMGLSLKVEEGTSCRLSISSDGTFLRAAKRRSCTNGLLMWFSSGDKTVHLKWSIHSHLSCRRGSQQDTPGVKHLEPLSLPLSLSWPFFLSLKYLSSSSGGVTLLNQFKTLFRLMKVFVSFRKWCFFRGFKTGFKIYIFSIRFSVNKLNSLLVYSFFFWTKIAGPRTVFLGVVRTLCPIYTVY